MMNLRPALLAAAALAAALAALALCRWGTRGNRDPVSIAWEVQRGDELGAHIEAGRRRDEAKRALAAEVVAGRMTVREAADHFRRLDEADPSYPPGLPRPPGYERALRHSVLEWAWEVLAHQQRYAAAARWYDEVFTADPDVLTGPPTNDRYHAACAAARAGCGQGRDAADLDEETRAGFRRQAFGWLRADLEARRRLLALEPENARQTVANDMQDWLADPDFAGVRGPEALARLSEPERQAWQMLWAKVADTLARAERTTSPEQRAGSTIPLPER
jgi:hypothetical protein